MAKIRVFRNGRIGVLKSHITWPKYKDKHPDAELITGEIPTQEDLQEWIEEGGCETLDGCWTEPDGYCEHGKPSWLLALGWI